MKILIVIGTLSIFGLKAHTQTNDHPIHIQMTYGRGIVQSSSYSNYSLRGEYLLQNRIGLKYNFDYIVRKDSITQFHTSMGILAAPVLFGIGLIKSVDSDTTTKGTWGIIGGILLLILPDGLSYHFSPAHNWDINPYGNLLGLDFVNNRKNKHKQLKYTCSFGVSFTRRIVEFLSVSTFIETRQTAGYGWGLAGGVGLGVYLGQRKNTTN